MTQIYRPAGPVAEAVDQAHRELWTRFIQQEQGYAIVLDYAGLDGMVVLPTPEECREGKPNALAWWCPAENGAFFNGLYLDGLIGRWRLTGDPQDAERVKRIAEGLIRLAEVGDTPGFIARGIAADGRGHHLIGSDDQSIPWFYGLWKYMQSGLCSGGDRERIVRLMICAMEAIERLGWRMPCDREGYTFRGSWAEAGCRDAARVLFALKLMHALTGERKWAERYEAVGNEMPDGQAKSRFAWCEAGIVDEAGSYYESELLTKEVCASGNYPSTSGRRWPYWITASSQACLRELCELEEDPQRKAMFRRGLMANARRALAYITHEPYVAYDNDNDIPFEPDWRFLNELWVPQSSVDDALRLAAVQLEAWHRRSPRKVYEGQYMREPLFAAWFIVLSGDDALIAEARETIARLLTQYDWRSLYYSLFFIAENVYYNGLTHGLGQRP